MVEWFFYYDSPLEIFPKYAIEPSYLVTFRADYRNKRYSLDYTKLSKISSLNYLHHGNFTTTNVS